MARRHTLCLPPSSIQISAVCVSAYSTGRVAPDTALQMATEAERGLRQLLGPDVRIERDVTRETPETANGDGERCFSRVGNGHPAGWVRVYSE